MATTRSRTLRSHLTAQSSADALPATTLLPPQSPTRKKRPRVSTNSIVLNEGEEAATSSAPKTKRKKIVKKGTSKRIPPPKAVKEPAAKQTTVALINPMVIEKSRISMVSSLGVLGKPNPWLIEGVVRYGDRNMRNRNGESASADEDGSTANDETGIVEATSRPDIRAANTIEPVHPQVPEQSLDTETSDEGISDGVRQSNVQEIAAKVIMRQMSALHSKSAPREEHNADWDDNSHASDGNQDASRDVERGQEDQSEGPEGETVVFNETATFDSEASDFEPIISQGSDIRGDAESEIDLEHSGKQQRDTSADDTKHPTLRDHKYKRNHSAGYTNDMEGADIFTIEHEDDPLTCEKDDTPEIEYGCKSDNTDIESAGTDKYGSLSADLGVLSDIDVSQDDDLPPSRGNLVLRNTRDANLQLLSPTEPEEDNEEWSNGSSMHLEDLDIPFSHGQATKRTCAPSHNNHTTSSPAQEDARDPDFEDQDEIQVTQDSSEARYMLQDLDGEVRTSMETVKVSPYVGRTELPDSCNSTGLPFESLVDTTTSELTKTVKTIIVAAERSRGAESVVVSILEEILAKISRMVELQEKEATENSEHRKLMLNALQM